MALAQRQPSIARPLLRVMPVREKNARLSICSPCMARADACDLCRHTGLATDGFSPCRCIGLDSDDCTCSNAPIAGYAIINAAERSSARVMYDRAVDAYFARTILAQWSPRAVARLFSYGTR